MASGTRGTEERVSESTIWWADRQIKEKGLVGFASYRSLPQQSPSTDETGREQAALQPALLGQQICTDTWAQGVRSLNGQ